MVEFSATGGKGLVKHNGIVVKSDQSVTVAVRRENIQLLNQADESVTGLRAVVKEKTFAGGLLQIVVTLEDGSELVSSKHGINSILEPNDHVVVTWDPEHAVIVDMEESL